MTGWKASLPHHIYSKRADKEFFDKEFEEVLRYTNHPDLVLRLRGLSQFEMLVRFARIAGVTTSLQKTNAFHKAFDQSVKMRHLFKVEFLNNEATE